MPNQPLLSHRATNLELIKIVRLVNWNVNARKIVLRKLRRPVKRLKTNSTVKKTSAESRKKLTRRHLRRENASKRNKRELEDLSQNMQLIQRKFSTRLILLTTIQLITAQITISQTHTPTTPSTEPRMSSQDLTHTTCPTIITITTCLARILLATSLKELHFSLLPLLTNT